MPKTTNKTSKAAFVRTLPMDMPAKQVIAKAKAAGFDDLSEAYVYVIRSKSNNAKRAAPLKPRAGGRNKPSSSLDHEFVNLSLELGFAKADALLKQTRAQVAQIARRA